MGRRNGTQDMLERTDVAVERMMDPVLNSWRPTRPPEKCQTAANAVKAANPRCSAKRGVAGRRARLPDREKFPSVTR